MKTVIKKMNKKKSQDVYWRYETENMTVTGKVSRKSGR